MYFEVRKVIDQKEEKMKNGSREIDKIRKEIGDINSRLVKLTAGKGEEAAKKTGDRLSEAISEFESVKTAVISDVTDAGRKIDEFVAEKHWQASAAAVAAGLISGFIMGRKNR